MSDSLFLVGVKDVRKHKGTEMQLVNPLRGGNTHQIKEWWKAGGVSTTYTTCTIFRVTSGANSVRLVIATGRPEGTELRIDHDGSFNFTFSYINEVERAALYTDDMQLIEHYVFPSIAGGPVMTVTPAGAAPKPGVTPPPKDTIDSATFNPRTANQTVGDVVTYTSEVTGSVSSYSYAWAVTGGTFTYGPDQASIEVTWTDEGAGSVGLIVGSTDPNWDSVSQTSQLDLTVAPVAPPPAPDTTIDSVSVNGETAPTEGENKNYTVDVTGDATPFTYSWSVTGGTVASGGATDTATITWNTAGAGSVTCTVGSSNANFDGNGDSDTLNVTVASAPPPPPPTGPVDSLTLDGNTSVESDGDYTNVATYGGEGSGLTVDYSVASNVVTVISIGDSAGNGYQEGDTILVNGDVGVTATVSIASILTANNVAADVAHVVTAAGGYYYIDGVQQAEVTADPGETIYFDLSDSSLSNHPFKIYTDSSKTTEVTVGVESDANGLIFTPPISGSFSYQCGAHAGMGGDITIS